MHYFQVSLSLFFRKNVINVACLVRKKRRRRQLQVYEAYETGFWCSDVMLTWLGRPAFVWINRLVFLSLTPDRNQRRTFVCSNTTTDKTTHAPRFIVTSEKHINPTFDFSCHCQHTVIWDKSVSTPLFCHSHWGARTGYHYLQSVSKCCS